MIIQLNTIADNISLAQFGNISNNRFFHDHFVSIINTPKPIITGELNGKNQSFILHFKLSNATIAETIRIRGLNCTLKDIKPNFPILTNWEVEINVKENIDEDIYILFDCAKTYGTWILQFGEGIPKNPSLSKVEEWTQCRAAFEYFAIIRVSKPIDESTIAIPRFIASPKYSLEQIGNPQRGSVGQPYGRNIRQLKKFTVSFTRVRIQEIEKYIKTVGLATPHFIVPYPENVFNIPPFWGTLQDIPEITKRVENGWYWNLSMSWLEAY